MNRKHLTSAVLAVLSGLALINGNLPAYGHNSSIARAQHRSHATTKQKTAQPQLSCEKYVEFINASTDYQDIDARYYHHNQINWSPPSKRTIDVAISDLVKKCPGLLERACNGERVPLRLYRGGSSAAETRPCQIAIFSQLLDAPKYYVSETLAHEMTHLIDYGANLSQSLEWNRLITPLLGTYRHEFPDPAQLESGAVWRRAQARLKQLRIPDDYAAQNPSEALAEFTALIACSGFAAPPAVKAFISKNILARPTSPDPKSSLIRSACRALNRGDDDLAIRDFTKLLRIDPSYPFVYQSIGIAWWEKNEPEIAAYNFCRGRELLKKADTPDYSDDWEAICGLLQDVNDEIAENSEKQQSTTTAKTVGIMAVRAKKKS